jgi:hypothetical protein
MFSLYSYTKRPFSNCRTVIFAQKPSPITLISGKVQFPNVLLPYYLEMSLFQMSYCHSCMKSSSFSNFRLHFWTKRPFSNVRYFQMSVIFKCPLFSKFPTAIVVRKALFSKSPTFTAERNVFVQMFKDVRNDFVHVPTVARNVHYLPNVLLP